MGGGFTSEAGFKYSVGVFFYIVSKKVLGAVNIVYNSLSYVVFQSTITT